MKKSILSLGKVLNKADQRQINGGDCENYDPHTRTSTRGTCDPNSIYSRPIEDEGEEAVLQNSMTLSYSAN